MTKKEEIGIKRWGSGWHDGRSAAAQAIGRRPLLCLAFSWTSFVSFKWLLFGTFLSVPGEFLVRF